MLTRFAPAPTGYLHLGHVVNALHVWTIARDPPACASRCASRITIAQRSRPEYEAALLDDLDWLGFVPERLPHRRVSRSGPCDRTAERSSSDLRRRRLAPSDRRLPRGPCLRLLFSARARISAMRPAIRAPAAIAVDHARSRASRGGCGSRTAPRNSTTWLMGPQAQEPASQCGDVVIRDRLVTALHQFVAALTTSCRESPGRDSRPGSARLDRPADRPSPACSDATAPASFAHHGLIMKSPDAEAEQVRRRHRHPRPPRAAGWSPERVIGEAARLAGLGPGEPLSVEDAVRLLSGPLQFNATERQSSARCTPARGSRTGGWRASPKRSSLPRRSSDRRTSRRAFRGPGTRSPRRCRARRCPPT